MQTSKRFIMKKIMLSREFCGRKERENAKVAHFSGVATRRESTRDAQPRFGKPPDVMLCFFQYHWKNGWSGVECIANTLILLSAFMCFNYTRISGIQDYHYSLSCVALT